MSRRKQSRPRPVKALIQTDDHKLTPRWKAPCDIENGSDNKDMNCVFVKNKLDTQLPYKPYDDTDDKLSNNINHHTVSNLAVESSPSSSSIYASQTSASPFSVLPTASTSAPFKEMARCEQLPRNIKWNQEATLLDIEGGKCLLCSAHLHGGTGFKPPVEGKDYFIDSDGTLAIRNGVCPRSLALALFSEVCAQRSKYSKLLGENLLKFLLNLKQIVTKNSKSCPGENPSDFVNAQNVLNDFSFIKEQSYELTNGSEGYESADNFKMKKFSRSEAMENDIVSANIRDSSVNASFSQIPLLHDEEFKKKEKNLIGILSELPSDHLVCNSEYTDNIKSGTSDNESSSRVTSPTPSLSSVNSGPSDKAKQMTSTKRGCKILPVASTDGQTHYLCPVCNLELSSDHELTVHIRSHNQSGQQSTPNTCTICGKTLSSQSSLDRHMLVHSGERPFKCKICDLSFTTNGNMHRHSRIHEKSGITTSKPTGRKHSEHKTAVKEDLSFHDDKKSGPVDKTHQSTSVGSDFVCNRMGYQECAQLQPYYRFLFPSSSSHHLPFLYPQLMQYPTRMTLPLLQTLMNPFTGEPLASCVQIPSSMSGLVREPSPDLRVQKKLHCNMCDAVFTNQFSLESHMETHVIVDEKLEAENDSTCKSCKTIAKSEASLLLHSLKYHKTKNANVEPDTKSDDQKCAPSSPLDTNASSSVSKCSNAVGFQNLGFASFTTKKFPLIAKAFCENYPNTRAFRFPVYKCQDCALEFPVEGAKHLHEASHVPEEYTMCPKCNCHFSEPTRLQEHMQKHVADLKFEETFGHNDMEPEKCMLQYHFLAQFGLTPKEEIDQILNKTDCKNRFNSEDDEIKIVNSDGDDDDDSLQLNQTINISAQYDQNKTHCKMLLPTDIPLNMTVSNSDTISRNTLTLPSFRASKKLPEVSEDILPDNVSLSSLNTSTDNDPGPKNRNGSLGVLDVSVPPVFPCKYCSIELTSPRALKSHLYTHKSTSHFQCKVCTYSSTDKNTLLRHMRTHSGERPYKCAICEYSFTTKANCERHLRQKHGLEKNQLSDKLVCNKYIIANKNRPRNGSASIQSFQKQSSLSKACGVNLLSLEYLQQDNYASSDCRLDYVCKICMKTSPSYNSIIQHINLHHPDIEQHKIEKLIACVENSSVSKTKLDLASPPHAHLKSPLSSAIATKCSAVDTMTVKQEHNISGSFDSALIRPDSEHFAEQLNMLFNGGDEMDETSSDKPLDFSKQQKYKTPFLQRKQHQLVKSSCLLPYNTIETNPIDLSVSKSSTLVKDQDQGSSNQRYQDVPAAAQKSEFMSALLQSFHDCNGSFGAGADSEDDTVDKGDNPGTHTNSVMSIKSPTESNSSCELASVNKILDATDAQNFQNFLHIPETEDEQEMYISESASGDEDSIVSLEHMNSHLQTMPSKDHLTAKPTAAIVKTKRADKLNITFTDPSRMSEQTIAELIEKVSQENGVSPAKKKKNSYADSPHKFSCPYCPRCFPWHSSLNRHLLTHTGQKPFKCPRCPVIFSTKSNRERHLIRKHNVNMLDPASRSTMDRPYKCHICMFSSFSTQNNLMKHYRDKHKGVAAPARGLGVDKSLCDGEWEDSLHNGGSTSYEDEEEYNSIVEMQGGLSDREIMLENYTQDSDSNHSSTSGSFFRGAHKIQNAIFNVNTAENHKYTNFKNSDNNSYINLQFVSKDFTAAHNDNMLTDKFKSVLQTGEDRNRKTIKNSSKFITSDIKRPFPDSQSMDIGTSINQNIQCLNCDQSFSSYKLLAIHQKDQHCELPFKCTFCEDSFATRLQCLQHFEQIHQEAWAVLKEKNEIGNIQVFSTRLDKMIDKLCKKELETTEKHEKVEQDCVLQEQYVTRDDIKWSKTTNGLKKTRGIADEEQPEVHLNTKITKLMIKKHSCINNGFEDIADPEVVKDLCSEVFCALCPKRLKSLHDLRGHMHSHVGKQRVHLDQLKTAVNSKLMCLSATVTTSDSFSSSTYTDKKNKGGNGNNMDMLHNLLGVESSTIDQIFESSDSAASLLGVCL